MTVERIDTTACAAWTYVDERDITNWKVLIRHGGEWFELGEDGLTYDQTPEKLREFIDEWIAEAADGLEEMPPPDVIEVYRQAAAFIDEHS